MEEVGGMGEREERKKLFKIQSPLDTKPPPDPQALDVPYMPTYLRTVEGERIYAGSHGLYTWDPLRRRWKPVRLTEYGYTSYRGPY